MIIAALILILSTAMFFFYFQATCQRILRRQFERDYSQSIAKVVRLEFPSLRKTLEESAAPVDYSRLSRALKADFLALAYLLGISGSPNRRYSLQERLLILYFRCHLISFAVRRLVKAGEKKAFLRLASVLQYFANVVGQRLNGAGFGSLMAAEPLLELVKR